MRFVLALKRPLISFAIVVAIWQLVATFGGFNPALFPSPLRVAAAFRELATTGLLGSSSDATLWTHLLSSARRFIVGYSVSSAAAILCGLALGLLPRVFGYVDPIVQLIRPVAPIAWTPFLVLTLGIWDLPAIAIIFIAGFFPTLLATVAAVRNMPPVYDKVARNFGLNGWEKLTQIVFPAVFPQIATSLRQALGTCWIFLVSGEMVGASSGLGFLVMDAKNCIRADALLATVILIGLIGFALDLLVRSGERLAIKKWGGDLKSNERG